MRPLRILVVGLLALLTFGAVGARADVAVLLEEPYSYDGAFAGTGHAAVYLSNICANSPTSLRRCLPGESGVVISRYHRVAGYDWIATDWRSTNLEADRAWLGMGFRPTFRRLHRSIM